MSAEKSEGLMLRLTDFSETSRIASIFTRDFGRISALAKGGRRLKGPFESALDVLARCHIVFLKKSSHGLDLLTEARLVQRFRPDPQSLSCLYGGYYVAELLGSLTEEYDPHPTLFDAAVAALDRLEHAESARSAILRFELTTLQESGHLPELGLCVECGHEWAPGESAGFSSSLGGLLCRECQREGQSKLQVHAETIALLIQWTNPSSSEFAPPADEARDDSPESTADSTGPSLRSLKEIQFITAAAVANILGRRPKMWDYIKDLR